MTELCPKCKKNEIETATNVKLTWKANETRFNGCFCIHCLDDILRDVVP